MAIKNNNSNNKNKCWDVGERVSIGFMKGLIVTGVRAEKDGLPDIYSLESSTGKKYEFIPHNGLYAI